MDGSDLRVLFTYRLLVQAGFLDDDIAPATGTWLPRHPQRIGVLEDLCIGCYACREECPVSAIRVWDGLAHITNPLACDPCEGIPCVASCPTGAIEERNAGAPGAQIF